MNPNLTAYDACFKKKLYWTEDDARESATRSWSRHGVNLDVYPCEIGNGGRHFHVGHHAARAEAIQRLRTFGPNTVLTNRS